MTSRTAAVNVRGPVALEVAVTANGQAVLERVFPRAGHEMPTVDDPACDRLLARHHCALVEPPATGG